MHKCPHRVKLALQVRPVPLARLVLLVKLALEVRQVLVAKRVLPLGCSESPWAATPQVLGLQGVMDWQGEGVIQGV